MNEVTKTAPLAKPALSRASFKPLRECNTLGEAFQSSEFRERIAAAAPAHIKPGRLLQTFIGAVSKNPLLGECSVRSYIGACLTLSQTGFEANTALGHAYLIPFRESKWNPATRKREPVGVNITVIFGYAGLIDLSYRTGLVRNIHPDIVFPGDEFSFEYGSNAHLKHVPRQRREGDVPLYAYMHAQLKDGQAFEVLPYGDVLAIRNKSQGYRYALEAKDKAEAEGKRLPPSWTETPWVAHEFAMARKTAVRAGSKWLPRSVELYSALALEDAQDRGRHVDFGSVMDAPTIDGSPDYLSAAAEAASDEPPVDPAAAHGDRRAVQGPVHTAEPAPPPPRAHPTPPPPPPSFEAVLIDANGETDGEVFTHRRTWARAFLDLWETRESGTDEALLEHNADALAEARRNPEAAALLDSDQPGAAGTDADAEAATISVITPPLERGKVNWAAYLKLLKAGLAGLDRTSFPEWLNAQRETLADCPTAQRVLAVRAIAEAAAQHKHAAPAWIADLVKPAPKPDAEAPAEDGDARWVDGMLDELASLDRDGFDALVASTAVRTKMARLRREKPALFERADDAFTERHQALPPAAGSAP